MPELLPLLEGIATPKTISFGYGLMTRMATKSWISQCDRRAAKPRTLPAEKSVRRNAKFASVFNTGTLVQSSAEKDSNFVFSEIVFVYAYPASARGALRAIVTTREAGMRWTRWLAACDSFRMRTNGTVADVKARGPDTPVLVSNRR